jgi:hypothetical protein
MQSAHSEGNGETLGLVPALAFAQSHRGARARSNESRAYRKIRLFEAIRPPHDSAFDAGSLLDFERPRLENLYRLGQAAATGWLVAGPRKDKDEPDRPRSAASELR